MIISTGDLSDAEELHINAGEATSVLVDIAKKDMGRYGSHSRF